MESQQVQTLVARYQAALKQLDQRIDRLSETEKKKYEKLRERFVAQIRSWQQVSQREYQQLESNLEESYNELEAVWFSVQQR